MTKKGRKLAAILLVMFLAFFLWFGFKYKWSFGCWAYYDQCMADKIPGLTEKECLQRGDAVAYLLEQKICLVKPKAEASKRLITKDFFKIDSCLDQGGAWDYDLRVCKNY